MEKYLYGESRVVSYNSQVKSPKVYDNGDYIVFDITEYMRLEDVSTFEKSKVVGVFNYKTNEFSKIVGYPTEFRNKAWSSNDVMRNTEIVNGNIYINFSKSRNIYVYNLSGEFIQAAKVGIDEIKESKGLQTGDPIENAMIMINNGYYPKMIYDKWRKVFYRFAVYMDTNEEIRTPEDFGRLMRKKTLSIITFDQNLNILAKNNFASFESGLNEEIYFVNENGLYILTYIPNFTENQYNFTKFNLIPKQ